MLKTPVWGVRREHLRKEIMMPRTTARSRPARRPVYLGGRVRRKAASAPRRRQESGHQLDSAHGSYERGRPWRPGRPRRRPRRRAWRGWGRRGRSRHLTILMFHGQGRGWRLARSGESCHGHSLMTFRSVDASAGVRTRSDQSVTSGDFFPVVRGSPENRRVVRPRGSRAAPI